MKNRILSSLLVLGIATVTVALGLSASREAMADSVAAPRVASETFFDTPVSRNLKQNWTSGYFNNAGMRKYARGTNEEQTIMDVDGNLNIIYADDDYVYIQVIKNEQVANTLKIKKLLPISDTVIQDKSGKYYVTYGRNRDDSTSPATTAKLAFGKYDKNGNFLAKYEEEYDFQEVCLTSGATICQTKNTFFELGDTRLAINDSGVLAYNLSMSIYFKDMTGGSLTSVHYGNDTGFIYTSNMTSASSEYQGGIFSSHDMDDDVIHVSGDTFYFSSIRDATNRGLLGSIVCEGCGTGISKAKHDAYEHLWQHFNTCSGYNDNYTYTSYGNMISLENGSKLALVTAAEKEAHDAATTRDLSARNVAVQIAKVSALKQTGYERTSLPTDAFVTTGERTVRVSGTDVTDHGMKFLTDYTLSGANYPAAYTVRGVKMSETRFIVMWTESLDYYTQHTYYEILDSNGNVVLDKTLIPMGYTPTNTEPVYKDGYLYFSNTFGYADWQNVRTYKVKINDNSGTKNPVFSNTVKVATSSYTGKVGEHYNVGAGPTDVESADYYYPLYYSSDENVATVDENGEVTLVGEGTATITVRMPNTYNTATSKVTVKNDIVGPSYPDFNHDGKIGILDVKVLYSAVILSGSVEVSTYDMDNDAKLTPRDVKNLYSKIITGAYL